MSVAKTTLTMPYPGLRPFEAEDQPLFFGREEQVSAMLRQLEDHRFVAVVGSSGSGKSSLVRAGLLPAVHEGFLLGTSDWLTFIIKPGHQPYQRLVRALHRAARGTDETSVLPAEDESLTPEETATLAVLRRTDRGLLIALDELAISPERKVMVVVDQFEELFAFRRAGVNRDTVASRDEAAAFVGMLLRSAADPAGRVWAVLTMRSDFIGDCEAFLGLPEQISRSQFLVPRLDRRQMEEAITRPAAVEDGAYPTFAFEDGLVHRIINDAGDRPDQLPLMQHALMRTWKRAVARAGGNGPVQVSPEDYETAGGIEKALSLHADAAWDEIKDDSKKAHLARRLFLLLCDISPDGQITRRRPQVAEVQAVTGASVAEIEQVVRVFQQDDRNFLLSPAAQRLTAESYLDISHEALLRQWRLFAGEWQDQERRDTSELRRLAELANLRRQGQGVGLLPAQDLERIGRWRQRVSAEWACRYVTKEAWDEARSFIGESQAHVANEEEERRRQARQRRTLVRAMAIILVVATAFSVWQMVRALRAKREAEKATIAAQEALTRSFVRTIGASTSVIPAQPPDERAASWELAELEPANASVRQKVIEHWVQNPDALDRALKYHSQGLHAAIGLSLAVRNRAAPRLNELADSLVKALENSEGIEVDDLSTLGRKLAAVAAWMETREAAVVAARGAQVLVTVLEDPNRTDPTSFSNLVRTLPTVAAHVEARDAAPLAERMARALEDPQFKLDHRARLGSALEILAARMDAREAAVVAGRGARALSKALEDTQTKVVAVSGNLRIERALSKAMQDALEPDPELLSNIGDTVAALAFRMEAGEAGVVAARGAQALIKTLEDPKKANTLPLSELGRTVATLVARMEAREAATLAERLAKALEDAQETNHLARLGSALEGLAARMEAREAAVVAARGAQALLKALEDPKETDIPRLSSLGQPFAALAARMEAREGAVMAARGAQTLLKALEDTKETNAYLLSSLGQAVAALAARMEEAAAVAGRGTQALIKTLENAQGTDAEGVSKLVGALEALVARMETREVAPLAERMAKALEDAPETDVDGRTRLGRTLAALAAGMEAREAAAVAVRGAHVLIKSLEDPLETSGADLSRLSRTLAALAARMPATEAAKFTTRGAQALARALGNPQETDADHLSTLGWALGELSHFIPDARATQLAALSHLLLVEFPKPGAEPEERKKLAALDSLLGAQDLAEVLKWPFCVGEAQQIALAELEKKTGGKFGGDLWKFVELAPSLGIKDLDAPAKRPRIEDALQELEALRAGAKTN
ncbi:MAG: hypothetical protein QOE70_3787 [Chthoniobacter sp.]|jgi:energy-coupling factor transporter ATP-binding protein EcfA2|nr:hypothetical protein [Chthoniobacter sp.]